MPNLSFWSYVSQVESVDIRVDACALSLVTEYTNTTALAELAVLVVEILLKGQIQVRRPLTTVLLDQGVNKTIPIPDK